MFSIMKNNITAKNMRLGVTEKRLLFAAFFRLIRQIWRD